MEENNIGLHRRKRRVNVRRVSKHVFGLSPKDDRYKVDSLCILHGVGPAVASAILTFYNPKEYGVFDIHIWREFYDEEPEFTTEKYLILLSKLRSIAKERGLNVRTVEKAYFKKNIDEE